MSIVVRIACVCVFVCFHGSPALAQGIVTGTVADETGGVLPGVNVHLQPDGVVTPLESVTDGTGRYRFEDLPIGPAELVVRLINFSTVRRSVVIPASGTLTEDVRMFVAASADIVVTAPRTFRNLAEIENPAENLVGVAGAGSEGAITAAQLAVRPVNRATEILETVPGMIISQHSGEGKANQYYLRGFNLDHGFDFAQTVAGIPVNMPTHAHAQGYADSNFLIPELVSGVQFRKGPYYAENGDFSSAGSANINYFNVLDHPIASVSGGSFGYGRFLGAASPAVGGGHLLAAFEWERDDGPWVSPNGKDKLNGVVRYSEGDSRNGMSVTFLGFENHWHSTDQIPQRAVGAGLVDRFGFIEESDGGETYRYAGVFDWQRSGQEHATRVTAFTQRYGVRLFHNFTYFLNDPVNGDQFEQFENRWTAGGKLTHRFLGHLGERHTENALGVDLRYDSVGGPLGLYLTRETERLSTVRADEADQVSIGLFGKSEVEWSRTVRMTYGLRGDVYHWNVAASSAPNSGRQTSAIASPKVSAAFGPWAGTELYANYGLGFHSNSALGITLRVDPFTGEPAAASPPFARSQGAEFGVRTVAVRGLQSTVTLWYLDFDSELIYVGDSGSTEDGPASRRVGVEITNYIYPNPWVNLDLDLSFSRARFIDVPAGDAFVPGALNRVVSVGVEVNPPAGVRAGPFGSLRLRHFGPRPLLEDDSVRSKATSIVNGELGCQFSDQVRVSVEGFNLFDAEVSDIDYFFTSRLRGEPAEGVDDIHFHAAIPRSARAVLQVSF
ncbi:MAG: TonB-dependent receptor [Acidimicrobiia bacterium]|nr:TonB-dependent receptor [Acidimicrobiia bacterium]